LKQRDTADFLSGSAQKTVQLSAKIQNQTFTEHFLKQKRLHSQLPQVNQESIVF
jgi:hypothetical protein